MAGYIESYRGVVKAWECDHVEHFTVAYYFKSASAAQLRVLQDLGIDPFDKDFPTTTHVYTRFLDELRKGDTYFIKSAVIAQNADSLTIGHRVINAQSGTESTLIEMTLDRGIDQNVPVAEWAAPEKRELKTPEPAPDWPVTAIDVVSTAPLDLQGSLSMEGLVHMFSDASVQSQTLIGMTSQYMRENRIGFSTMEFRFVFHQELPRPGDRLEIRSNITNIGGTSLGFAHGLWNVGSGKLLATLSQAGVHLDLDKRRPSRLPDMIRASAEALLAK